MKKIIVLFNMLLCFGWENISAQSAEAEQLLLNVEKLAQLKKILSGMKEGYTIVSQGYATISNISKGNFNLHDAFLNGLLEVSTAIKKYKRVADIIHMQSQIVQEYRTAENRFSVSGLFSGDELNYISSVYSNLLNKSLQNLGELSIVMTAGTLRMSDDERIAAIDRVYNGICGQLNFLRGFNDEASVLVMQRKRDLANTKAEQKLNGF
jgi:hypothetical protein